MSERRSARQPKPNHKADYFRFSDIELTESDLSDIDSTVGDGNTAMENIRVNVENGEEMVMNGDNDSDCDDVSSEDGSFDDSIDEQVNTISESPTASQGASTATTDSQVPNEASTASANSQVPNESVVHKCPHCRASFKTVSGYYRHQANKHANEELVAIGPAKEPQPFPFEYKDCALQALQRIASNATLNMEGAALGNTLCKYAGVLFQAQESFSTLKGPIESIFAGFQVTEDAANQKRRATMHAVRQNAKYMNSFVDTCVSYCIPVSESFSLWYPFLEEFLSVYDVLMLNLVEEAANKPTTTLDKEDMNSLANIGGYMVFRIKKNLTATQPG